MGETYPKLRSGLEIRRESSDPHSSILLKDPIVKRFYRFSPVQGEVLQLMAERNKTISQLVAEIPRYEIVKTKFECKREDANRAVEALKAEFAREKIDTQDGLRIDWEKSWVHARPSNTEPIMRIIAEAPTREEAQQRIDQLREVVNKVL